MTSKEELENLSLENKFDTLFCKIGDDSDIKHINIVYNGKTYSEKDLEMLDIIKKYERIFYVSTILPPYVILSGSSISDVEDAKKIKEWLEK